MYCDVEKTFVNNNKLFIDEKQNRALLEKLKNAGKSYIDVLGAFASGNLLFPTEERKDPESVAGYKSFFGPVFYSGAVCYTKESTSNLSKALRRLTCKREADDLAFDDRLKTNQETNLGLKRLVFKEWAQYMFWLQWRIKNRLHSSLGEIYSTIEKDAHRPHAKIKLRIAAFASLLRDGIFLSLEYMKNVGGKIKCPEWGKFGKYPRLIGDYTCPGSLLGGALTACIKHCFEEWYTPVGEDLRMRFVYTPNYDTLKECYEYLLTSTGSVFVYHSDDCCMSLKCVDGHLRANVDISSCDASNGETIFNWFLFLVKDTMWYGVAKKCVEQCEKPLKIFNPLNRKEKVTLSSTCPIEYSGTVLTTVLNNIASSAICLSIHKLTRGKTVEEAALLLQEAAEYVGYKITIGRVSVPEDFQFLKTSPTLTDDGVVIFLNLGVVLRSLGTCDHDLPGRGCTYTRAWNRNVQIIKGYAHAGNNSVLNGLRARFRVVEGDGSNELLGHWMVENLSGFHGVHVSDDVICRRYGMAITELEHLCELIRECDIGHIVACEAIRKIYKVDYDL